MKRNWDTVREILTKAEELESGNELTPNEFERDRVDEIAYHVKILEESGLIKAKISENVGGPVRFYIDRLTWQGHEFLDAIKNDTVWKKINKVATEKGVTMPLDIIKGAAIKALSDLVL
jgi:predicted transcriptional regulator